MISINVNKSYPITIKSRKIINYNQIRNDTAKIVEKLKQINLEESHYSLKNLQCIIHEQRLQYRPRKIKPLNYFKLIDKVENLIISKCTNEQKLNWLVKKHRIEEYNRFLDQILISKLEPNIKNYYIHLLKIFNLKPRFNLVDRIINPHNPDHILTDPKDINKILTEKYRNHFGNSSFRKEQHTLEGNLPQVTQDEVTFSMQNLSRTKAIAIDLIPDNILSHHSDEELVKAITEIINQIIEKKFIPKEICTGRLILITV